MERAKGFEPSTSTLARLRSTPELHPRSHLEQGAVYRIVFVLQDFFFMFFQFFLFSYFSMG